RRAARQGVQAAYPAGGPVAAAPYRAYGRDWGTLAVSAGQAQRRPAMNIRRDAMVRLKNPSSP
ncbi:hypothetical protein K4G89_24245, partial [Mycobacterium tuberculosis]|nr:hypothetical protein [Mycobacterium tuberculosis]